MQTLVRVESFEATFQDLYPRAIRSVQRLLGDRTQAEDIASEALARAFADWATIEHLPHRDAWVLRVAMNLALDSLRRRVPFLRPAAPVDASEVATLRVALWAALRSLPKRQREIIVLRFIAGLNDDEVAQSLDISPLTVKTHRARGLSTLRKKLSIEDEEALLGLQ
jgi:RNA polymerase sigma-70 factor, ECF subfamily